MLRLSNNRVHLWQWDADQTLVVEREDVTEVHFRDLRGETAMVMDVIDQDGKHVVPIPNVLLTEAKPIDAYAYRIAGDMATLEHITIEVKARQKPADYVYTETEVKRWETLEERIVALEQNGGGGGITQETDPTVPDWAKQPSPPEYTLPPATADTLGGVMVGEGLQMTGGVLAVKAKPKFEPIETLVIKEAGIKVVDKDVEPDGTPYSFTEVWMEVIVPLSGSKVITSWFYDVNGAVINYMGFSFTESAGTNVFALGLLNVDGLILPVIRDKSSVGARGNLATDWRKVVNGYVGNSLRVHAVRVSTNEENGFAENTEIRLYGVRSNA